MPPHYYTYKTILLNNYDLVDKRTDRKSHYLLLSLFSVLFLVMRRRNKYLVRSHRAIGMYNIISMYAALGVSLYDCWYLEEIQYSFRQFIVGGGYYRTVKLSCQFKIRSLEAFQQLTSKSNSLQRCWEIDIKRWKLKN